MAFTASAILTLSDCHPASSARLLLFKEPQMTTFSETRTHLKPESGPDLGIDSEAVVLESPELKPGQKFDQMVISWNAECPSGTYVILEARAKKGEAWTRWFNMGYWSTDSAVLERTSVKGQKDADGSVDTDTLSLAAPTDIGQLRVTLCSTNGVKPELKLLSCDFSLTSEKLQSGRRRSAKSDLVVDVPEISQRDYTPKGDVWCSPTSVTMVLNYWAKKLDRPDLKKDVPVSAACIFDKSWGGTGNWTFNTAFAGSQNGMVAYCKRMSGFDEMQSWLKKGIPVILSISSNTLHGSGTPGGGGHLIVAVGVDSKGDIIVNDPYTTWSKGQKVRRTYDRKKLLAAWQSSQGMTYLIYPQSFL